MPSTTRARTSSLILLAAFAVPLGISAAACGGSDTPPATTPTASAIVTAPPATAPTVTAPEAVSTASAAPPPPTPVPTSSVAKTKTDPGWISCHATFAAKRKEVSADVEAMAKLCAATTKMKPMGKPMAGKQADQDVAQSFPLAARSGHCYRAYAQGSDGIQDLDLVIKDSAGIIVGQDSTDDASPVVMEDGAVCFQKDDAATVVISVGMGKGTYAIQVWSD
jgi:hypothetical protein